MRGKYKVNTGKTTLLRRLAIELADNACEDSDLVVPVYVQLRGWPDAPSTDHLVRRELSRLAPAAVAKSWDLLASQGNVIFLLDGVDEIEAERRSAALDDILRFMDRFPRSRFVVAGRPGNYLTSLERSLAKCEFAPWSHGQMQEMCWHKLDGHSRPWKHFWTRLVAEPDICEMSTNPLVLSLLLARYVNDALSPHYASEAVTGIVDALANEWDSVRGIRRRTATTMTDHMWTMEELLSEMAA